MASENVLDPRPMALARRAKERARLLEESRDARISEVMKRKAQALPEIFERELRVWSLGLGAGSALMVLWGFNSDDPNHLKKAAGALLGIGALAAHSTAEGAEELQKQRRRA